MTDRPPEPSPLERAAAALRRLGDEDSKYRAAWILEEIVGAVVASALDGRKQLELTVIAQGGKLARKDVTIGFQKHANR